MSFSRGDTLGGGRSSNVGESLLVQVFRFPPLPQRKTMFMLFGRENMKHHETKCDSMIC